MLDENMNMEFTILQKQFTDSFLSKMVRDRKYDSVKRDQDVIGVMRLVKGVMLKFDRKTELIHTMWEDYVLILIYKQHSFEINQKLFEKHNSTYSVIIQYDISIVQDNNLVKNSRSKDDA